MTPLLRDPAPDLSLFPGGRWAEILQACADAPRSLGDLRRATCRPVRDRHERDAERRKVLECVIRMAQAGLLAHDPAGFQATPFALAEMARLGIPLTSPLAGEVEQAREGRPGEGSPHRHPQEA